MKREKAPHGTSQSEIQNEDRILNCLREKQRITYKSKPARIRAYFSTETLKGRRAQNEMFEA